MKINAFKLLSFRAGAISIAVLVVLVFIAIPVSASTCHPGFVVIRPSSSFQYSQPSFSSVITTSPALNQGSGVQFSQPALSRSAPGYILNGKTYSPSNPFRW
jgi:hypothetical protein